jgi:hypothetical protein
MQALRHGEPNRHAAAREREHDHVVAIRVLHEPFGQ